jgi:iduronate 2-sulfatase
MKLFGRLFIFLCTAVAHAAEPRLNVLFICSDDLRPELGCYGAPGVKTPHIDALAARSVRFNHAYAQFPLCGPSRASMLTGRYPTTTKIMDNTRWVGGLFPEGKTLPRFFRDNGYETRTAGKIFHGGLDDYDAWMEGGQKRRFEGVQPPPPPPRPAGAPKAAPRDRSKSDRVIVLEGEGEKHDDYLYATRTIEHLKRAKESGRPFFIACGFGKPHCPPEAPQKYLDLYDANKISLPVDFAPNIRQPMGAPIALTMNGDLFLNRDASEAEAREMIRGYWAATSFVDEQVGRVMAALDESGLASNTIVVFWGDHGYHLGEKGKWSKHSSLFEVGTRVPLLISVPTSPAGFDKLTAGGRVCERIVESIDLYPTLTDLCGFGTPGGLEGASLRPLLRDPTTRWDRPAYSFARDYTRAKRPEEVTGCAIRTERWRYAEWYEGKEGAVLYDHTNDPLELKNLAADPAHAGIVKELKAKLVRFPK